MTNTDATVTPAKDGRGGFFAVDRRAWHLIAGLGLNQAIAYLVMARGTGGDNRTTKWSTHAIEQYAGIARSRAKAAIAALEQAGAVWRDPESKRDHPRYKLVPAHEIRGCEGFPPPVLDAEHQRVYAALGTDWTEVPKSTAGKGKAGEFRRWGFIAPQIAAENLVKSGRAEQWKGGAFFRAIPYDTEGAARPDWIWLPNALVDGAADETPPIELMRQGASPLALRLLVNLYGSQNLDEDGGIHFSRIREEYARHKVGQQGPYVVWGFVQGTARVWQNAPFITAHLLAAAANDEAAQKTAWDEFWDCWRLLRTVGLVEFVAHLVTSDDPQGEIVHPVARPGTEQEIERELGQMATQAGIALVTPGQLEWANKQGVVMLAPVQQHMVNVQMLGIARLRYRPRTARTLAFVAREEEWKQDLARLRRLAQANAQGGVQH